MCTPGPLQAPCRIRSSLSSDRLPRAPLGLTVGSWSGYSLDDETIPAEPLVVRRVLAIVRYWPLAIPSARARREGGGKQAVEMPLDARTKLPATRQGLGRCHSSVLHRTPSPSLTASYFCLCLGACRQPDSDERVAIQFARSSRREAAASTWRLPYPGTRNNSQTRISNRARHTSAGAQRLTSMHKYLRIQPSPNVQLPRAMVGRLAFLNPVARRCALCLSHWPVADHLTSHLAAAFHLRLHLHLHQSASPSPSPSPSPTLYHSCRAPNAHLGLPLSTRGPLTCTKAELLRTRTNPRLRSRRSPATQGPSTTHLQPALSCVAGRVPPVATSHPLAVWLPHCHTATRHCRSRRHVSSHFACTPPTS